MDYVQEFNYLARNAPMAPPTNANKSMDGLSTKMKEKLSVPSFDDFNMMVSKSIMVEYKMKKHQEEKKRKRDT